MAKGVADKDMMMDKMHEEEEYSNGGVVSRVEIYDSEEGGKRACIEVRHGKKPKEEKGIPTSYPRTSRIETTSDVASKYRVGQKVNISLE